MKTKDFNDLCGTLEFHFNNVDRSLKTKGFRLTEIPDYGETLRRKCRDWEEMYREKYSESLTERQNLLLGIVYGQWLNKRYERIRNER